MVKINKQKTDKIVDVINYLDEKYPRILAWEEDLPRIGFVLGELDTELQNIILTLDINEKVIDEAVGKNVNLIITHHPLIFNPIYKIDYNSPLGKSIKKLVKNNISVYTMHTNFDVGIDGVADTLAQRLGLNNIIGDNVKDSYLRYGSTNPKPFKEYIGIVKERLGLSGLKYAGDTTKIINTIGIIGGSGGSTADIQTAIDKDIDLYISSEFKLNTVQYAVDNNLCIIETNHGIEKLSLYKLQKHLSIFFNINIYLSEIETDPFRFYV